LPFGFSAKINGVLSAFSGAQVVVNAPSYTAIAGTGQKPAGMIVGESLQVTFKGADAGSFDCPNAEVVYMGPSDGKKAPVKYKGGTCHIVVIKVSHKGGPVSGTFEAHGTGYDITEGKFHFGSSSYTGKP